MRDTEGIEEDECIAVWCAGEEWCAVTCTMKLIGNKWNPVIIDRLLKNEPLRFSELLDEIPEITNKVLSENLDDLEEKELIDRTVVEEKPVGVEYTLTEQGRSLESVIDCLDSWGEAYLKPAPTEEQSIC